MTCCVILLEVAIRRWRHCAHKGMDMVSSNTQVGCGVDAQLVLMDPKKISPTPLHHHHQPEPLIQGRMIHAFMLLSRASECVSRNGDSSEQQRFSNLLLSSFGVEQYIVSSLEEIKLRLTALERAVASIPRAKEVMLPGGVLLPLQDYQDLQSLELRMEDAQCQKDLTAYLGTIGGCNIQIATRRILTTLIGHNLATKLTWTGSSQKKPFQNLRLKRVVTDKNSFSSAVSWSGLHSHAYEWKSMERRVQCDRGFTIETEKLLLKRLSSTIIKMAFIKEESEDLKIEQVFTLKKEEPEELTDLMPPKQEDEEEDEFDFMTIVDSIRAENINAEREESKKNLSCQQCGLSFTSIHDLESHLSTHSNRQPFICGQCGKNFSRKDYLLCHMRIHTGEQPFKCGQCGKGFNAKTNYNYHMTIHIKEKSLPCDQCGKRFSHELSLNHHMRAHLNSFACKLCGKTFNRKESLKAHRAVHTKEHSYVCAQCGKSYTHKSSLGKHEKVHKS